MTIREAMNIISNNQLNLYIDDKKSNSARLICATACKKQLPLEPILNSDCSIFSCRICGTNIGINHNRLPKYCSECGHKISWKGFI